MPATDNPPAYLPNNQQAYFFAEGGSITQSTSQAFGPVAGNEAAEFRLTTKFSCAAPAKAYAICKGIVLIQPQTGTANKVNLLLRPFKQPYQGLNIKYFVYRGLRKQDFFTNGSDPQVISAVSSVTSEFINKINQDFDSFYSEPLYDQIGIEIPKPVFLAKYIGYNPQQPDATPVSDLFFKESVLTATGGTTTENDAYELPLIDEGKWLGYFETGEGGMDVVLNYGDYKNDFDNSEFVFDLAYARAAEAKIVLTGTDGNKKLQREQIFQFFDAAAFYGLFADGGKVKLYASDIATDKTGTALYTDVLAPFATRNNWYIYIQSDRTRSYDYYGNYKIAANSPNNLKIGISETSLAETQYGTYGWPLLINNQLQPVTDGRNRLYLQFVTDNNVNTALYGQVGLIENAQQNNFCNFDNLQQVPNAQGNLSELTNRIILATPAALGGNVIAAITLLVYKGVAYSCKVGQVTNQDGDSVDAFLGVEQTDEVFDLIRLKSNLTLGAGSGFSVNGSNKIKLVNYFFEKQQQGISAFSTKRVNDSIKDTNTTNVSLQRVTYVAEVVQSLKNSTKPNAIATRPTASLSPTNGSAADKQTFSFAPSFEYNITPFMDEAIAVKGLELINSDDMQGEFIVLGLSEEENHSLEDLITSTCKNPSILLVKLFEQNNKFISPENVAYYKYLIRIVQEYDNELKLFIPEQEITLYSLNNKVFFTNHYSMYVAEESNILVEASSLY